MSTHSPEQETASGQTPMFPTPPSAPPPEIPYRELFLSLIEEIPDAVFTKDLQGRYTLINKAGARFMGRPVEEILGRKDAELMSQEEAQSTLEFDRQVLAEELAGHDDDAAQEFWGPGVDQHAGGSPTSSAAAGDPRGRQRWVDRGQARVTCGAASARSASTAAAGSCAP